MSKIKELFSKPCLKRALRTFLQTAIGYILTNATLTLGGLDLSNGDVVKHAVAGLSIAAISAGASAVMNLKEGADKNNE